MDRDLSLVEILDDDDDDDDVPNVSIRMFSLAALLSRTRTDGREISLAENHSSKFQSNQSSGVTKESIS